MPDQLEQSLHDALSQRAAQLDPHSIARLGAIDYRPRRHRFGVVSAVSAVGVGGAAAALTAVFALSSGAAPAFAGWHATPTRPAPGQLSHAAQACGQSLGSPILTDSRGPYTASIYADETTRDVCLSGNGVSASSSSTSATPVSVAAGRIELDGGGARDSAGNALTLVDGRIGAGVTAVTIERRGARSVQATVANGWYMAWWPGTAAATDAKVTTASGTSTIAFPSTPALPAPGCPSSAHCASGYAFASGSSSGGSSSGSVAGGGSAGGRSASGGAMPPLGQSSSSHTSTASSSR